MNQLTTNNLKGFKNFLMVILLVFTLLAPLPVLSQVTAQEETVTTAETPEVAEPPSLSPAEIEKIEAFIQREMKIAKIPGLSLVIVKEDQTVYQKGFGFADLKTKEPVTPATLFELGSASKTFTGLAILQLVEKGLIKLDDPVSKYIPWFNLKYRGKEVAITIEHFLHHTTGLQYFETLALIPVSTADDALEEAVRALNGWELIAPPGQRETYTSIAYSVLGFIIQEVSGQSYEEYIKQNILMPLQMNNTYLFREQAREKGMATGYKISFGKPSAFDAPMFRGNTPGGYIISNSEDMAQWLKIQMGTVESPGISKELIEKSHLPAPQVGSPNYGAAWRLFPNLHIITHGGLNPNFSSFIVFGDEKSGVAVLANMGTMITGGIGQGIMAILRGREPQMSRYDRSTQFDNMSTNIVMVLSILLVLNLVLLVVSIIKIIKGKKRFSAKGTGRIIAFIIATLLMLLLIYLIFNIPSLLGINVPLGFGFIWVPNSFAFAIYWIFFTGFFLYLFVLSIIFFPKKKA